MDDQAAISRLYPVTAQNQSSFPGKQVFSSSTARIHGSVYFTNAHGATAQPMQGVNVVARWINPQTGQPSRRYAVSSVSGFLFTGNEGNPITGLDDAAGDPFQDWGSQSQTLEGFFDLAGLQLPSGSSAQYQLSVEAVDPTWSPGVGPYSPGPVSPSGSFQPITITVSAGGDVQQNILMAGSAQPLQEVASSWSSPANLPGGGDWISALGSYDDVAYFLLPAQANRTFSVAVTALDESGRASQLKAQPVIGAWGASDAQGTVPGAFTPSPFNTVTAGLTRLDAQVLTSGNLIVGISDIRGDGRPDYRYHTHVLYADSVLPARIGVSGGAITVQGTGFAPGLASTIGNATVPQLAMSAGQMILSAPASTDGTQDITITDPVSGASTTMTGALTYGAAATDNIVLLYGLNPNTPVGTQATNPVTVRVLAADGVTPVSGATIGWSANNGLQLSACSGASSCSVTSDQNGGASTWLVPGAPGLATITTTLAPGVYSPAKSVTTSLNATQSSSDIGVLTPYLWISQGASVAVPLTARVLSNGTPRSGAQVNFTVVNGTGNLSSASAATNSTGYAAVTLNVAQFSAQVQVSVCVAPGNVPCAVVYANSVPLAQQNLQPISGGGQVSTGSTFQPIVVRVTDSASPPNSVVGAPVAFLTTILRPGGTDPVGGGGETNSGNPAMPVILQVNESTAVSDIHGLASITASGAGFSPPVEVDVAASAGTSAFLDYRLFVLPALSSDETTASPAPSRAPLRATLTEER